MVKIILDTDLGRDCDDVGALSLLHTMASDGDAKILAVTLCTSAISSLVTVQAINEWYKRPDIPIGKYDKKVFLEEYSKIERERKRFSFMRSFKVIGLNLTTETGAEYLLPIGVIHSLLRIYFFYRGR